MTKEEPYKNREIKEMFADLTAALRRIETQTTTTNGRVSKLENWRYFITGGMSVIVIIVLPLLGWALFVLSNIQVTVQNAAHTAVDQALASYNITPVK